MKKRGVICNLIAVLTLSVLAIIFLKGCGGGGGTTDATLTAVKSGTGAGMITSSPAGINCGTDCIGHYILGHQVTLTATASAASTFGGWTGCDSTNNNQCTVEINADKTVTATFTANAGELFFDDFESYALGTFPSSGGWQLRYNGAGSSSQYVDNAHSVSGFQSLHLVGSSCWAAEAYHPDDIPAHVRLEAMVFVDQIVSCGCTPSLGGVSLVNPALGTWGTGFGEVMFKCDGNVYAVQAHYDRSKDVLLTSYNAGTWYRVKLDVDLTARSFDVYIDGVLSGSGMKILDSGMPTGVSVVAGHGGNPTVWFDYVNVSVLP